MKESSMKDKDRLISMLNYIRENYRMKLDLKTLSKQFYLSPSYISKYIGENLGIGFSEYLNDVRLGHALSELESTDHSVTQIACDAGFPNLVTFNRIFRQKYGTVPSVYRKKFQSVLRDVDKKIYRDTYQVTVDTLGHQHYEKPWLKVLNFGAAENLQIGYVREHILLLKRELDFSYGRIDSLFCPENLLDIRSEARYNFSVLDDILDFLIKNGIIPFLNLGLKGKKILRPDMASVLWQERISKIEHQDNYRRMLLGFICHCVERYGMREVLKWKFELWWERKLENTEITENQMSILKMEYNCIKSCIPDACVGGMGFNIFDNNESIRAYLSRNAGETMELDFISVSLYPYNIQDNVMTNNIIPDEHFVEQELTALQKLMAEYDYTWDKLWITEWNLSVSSRTWINDICYKGAYMVRNLIASVNRTPCMAYWMSTDRTEEYFDSVDCLYGGGGMISRDGIPKAAFYALYFMKSLGKYLLAKGENYIVTSTEQGHFYLVCHHMQSPTKEYYTQWKYGENHPEDIRLYFRKSELNIHISLVGVTGSNYLLKKHSVSPAAGSFFEEWARRGFTRAFEKEELDDLKSASLPYMETQRMIAVDGALNFKIKLQANEIQLICIVPEKVAISSE